MIGVIAQEIVSRAVSLHMTTKEQVEGFLYYKALCVHCNDAEVDMVRHSVSQVDYLDLDCSRCGSHLITLYRHYPVQGIS